MRDFFQKRLEAKLDNYASMDLNCWPLILLIIISETSYKFIREYCCYCQKNLKFSRSSRVGDSGGICLSCLYKECPDAYYSMKNEGKLTARQIRQVEGST